MPEVFSIAWLIIVFPIVGLLINLAFGRRMGEREPLTYQETGCKHSPLRGMSRPQIGRHLLQFDAGRGA